jgi:hypothetical protein
MGELKPSHTDSWILFGFQIYLTTNCQTACLVVSAGGVFWMMVWKEVIVAYFNAVIRIAWRHWIKPQIMSRISKTRPLEYITLKFMAELSAFLLYIREAVSSNFNNRFILHHSQFIIESDLTAWRHITYAVETVRLNKETTKYEAEIVCNYWTMTFNEECSRVEWKLSMAFHHVTHQFNKTWFK